jgi:hypothetical protein
MEELLEVPLGRVVPRRARQLIDEALADTRVVLVNGARQAGKSTLVRLAGAAIGAEWQTLDAESSPPRSIGGPGRIRRWAVPDGDRRDPAGP